MSDLPAGLDERLWLVINDAVRAGVTVPRFVAACREAWADVLVDVKSDADREWKEAQS